MVASEIIQRNSLVEKLRERYSQVRATGRGEFLLIYGPEGVGKTTLVESLFFGEELKDAPEAQMIKVRCKQNAVPGILPVLDLITAAPETGKNKGKALHRSITIVNKAADGFIEYSVQCWPDIVSLLPMSIGLLPLGGTVIATAHLIEKMCEQFDFTQGARFLERIDPIRKALPARLQELCKHGPVILLIDQFESAQGAAREYFSLLAEMIQEIPVLAVFTETIPDGETGPSEAWARFTNTFRIPRNTFEVQPFQPKEAADYAGFLLKKLPFVISPETLEKACRDISLKSAGLPGSIRELCELLTSNCGSAEQFEIDLANQSSDFDSMITKKVLPYDHVQAALAYGSLQGDEVFTDVMCSIFNLHEQSLISKTIETAQRLQFIAPLESAGTIAMHQFTHSSIRRHFYKENRYRLAEIQEEVMHKIDELTRGQGKAVRCLALGQMIELGMSIKDRLPFCRHILEACEIEDAAYGRKSLSDEAEKGLRRLSDDKGICYPASLEAWSDWLQAILEAYKPAPANSAEIFEALIELLLFRARAAELLDERIPGKRNRLNTKIRSLADEIFSHITVINSSTVKANRGEEFAHCSDYLQSIQDPEMLAKTYLRIGYFYHWEYFHSDRSTSDEEKIAFGNVEKLLKRKDVHLSPKLLAKAECGVGFRYRGRSIKKGEPHYEIAKKMAATYQWPEIEATAEHNLGYIYYDGYEDSARAKESWIRALNLREIPWPPKRGERYPFEAGNTLGLLGRITLKERAKLVQFYNFPGQNSDRILDEIRQKEQEAEVLLVCSIDAQKGDTSHILGPYLDLIRLYIGLGKKTFESANQRAWEIARELLAKDDRDQLTILRDFLVSCENVTGMGLIVETINAQLALKKPKSKGKVEIETQEE